MHWLKKGIFIIGSCCLFIGSCQHFREGENTTSKTLQNSSVAKEVNYLFSILDSSQNVVHLVDSIAKIITEKNPQLTYFSTNNDYEPSALLFSSKELADLNLFIDNEYLVSANKSTYEEYQVFSKTSKRRNVIEFSVEPHPTLGWVFVIRNKNGDW